MRGRYPLSYFVWVIVFRLDYIRYVEFVLNIEQRKVFGLKELDIAFSFRHATDNWPRLHTFYTCTPIAYFTSTFHNLDRI